MVNQFYKYRPYRARYIVSKLSSHFKSLNTVKKATIELPHNIVLNSREHFLYIFYGCLLDYGVRSVYYHNRLRTTYLSYPFIFEPVYIVENFKNNLDGLAKILRDYLHIRFPSEGAKRWFSLSHILYYKYDNNPINLIKFAHNFDSLKKRILEIRGFGQKTGGLLIRILYENNLLQNYLSEQYIPFIPIDRHDIDISIKLGVFEILNKRNPKNLPSHQIDKLSKLWVDASILENIDPAETDRNLWLLGSQSCAFKKCRSCPVIDLCNQSYRV